MKRSQIPINFDPIIKKFESVVIGGLGSIVDRIPNRKKFVLYLGIMLIGLSASRLANSIFMYFLSTQIQAMAPASVNVNRPQTQANAPANYDLSSVIDGVFFKRVAVESSTPEAATEEVKNFSLIGTLEGDPSFARAVIRMQGTNEDPREYGLGEKIGAATLIAIGYEKIWIRLNGNKIKIEVGENMQDVQSKNAASSAPAISGGTRVITRQEVNEKILGNPAALYGGGAAFGPNIVAGKIEGFRLHRVPENHVLYELGARSGDIVKSVNGYALSNTGQMMEVWNNIKTMPRISVDIERDGKPMKIDFEIRN